MTRRPLKLLLAALTLVGLLASASLWWTGMHQGGSHSCPAAAIQQADCPNASTTAAVTFHLNTVPSFAATLQAWSLSVLLAVALIALAISVPLAPARSVGPGRWADERRRRLQTDGFWRWLARLEHSPSI